MIDKMANIHKGAKLAKDVKVEAFATIYEDVEIGSGSWIGPNTVIMNGARIGKNVQVFPGAVISGDPQDMKYQGEYTTAEIGDNTIIREYVTINKGTKAKERNGTLIRFIPDPEIFGEFEWREEYLEHRLRYYAFLNSGLTLDYNGMKYISRNGSRVITGAMIDRIASSITRMRAISRPSRRAGANTLAASTS